MKIASRFFTAIQSGATALALPVTLTLLAQPASAQKEEDVAAARALATQGVTAYGEGRYKDSLDLFTRAESLLHAPPHVLYLARSASKLGQLVRARELFLKLGREELPANAPQAFRDAQTQARTEASAIEPRLASVDITLKTNGCASPKIEMDGKPVSAAVLGVPIPADPGKHHLAATAEGCRSLPVEVTLTEGGKGNAALVLEPSKSEPVAVPVAQPVAPLAPVSAPPSNTSAPAETPAKMDLSAPANNRDWMRPASYVAYGVGALGLGAGVLFGLDSRSKRKDADASYAACEATSGGCTLSDPQAQETTRLDNLARKRMTISVIGIVAAVAGIGGGTTLLLLAPHKESAPKSAKISPWVGVGSVGLTGTW